MAAGAVLTRHRCAQSTAAEVNEAPRPLPPAAICQVAKHTAEDDVWIIVGGAKTGGPKVYDISK